MRNLASAIALGAVLVGVCPSPSAATAIAGGFSGPASIAAYVSIIAPTNQTLSGLVVTATPLQFASSALSEGNGTAVAELGGLRQSSSADGGINLSVGIRLQATALATGHAVADAKEAFSIHILNAGTVAQSFLVQAHYAIGTRVTVSDLQTESVLAYWNIGTIFEDFGLKHYGEFGRTIDCSFPLQSSYICPNFYDSNDSDRYPLSLAPGESLSFEMRAIARFEATAVSEPSTIALLAFGALAIAANRRRQSSSQESFRAT